MPVITPTGGGGGGGATAAKLFLSTSQATAGVHPPVAPNSIVFDFPADGEAGADITLSADGTTFTLVNSGVYSVFVGISLSCTLADTPEVLFVASSDVSDPYSIDGFPQVSVETLPAATDKSVAWTLPAMYWTAGATFHFTQASQVSNTNVTIHNTVVIVSRVL